MVSTVAQERRISPHILSNLPSRLWAPVNVLSEIDRSTSFIACSHNTAHVPAPSRPGLSGSTAAPWSRPVPVNTVSPRLRSGSVWVLLLIECIAVLVQLTAGLQGGRKSQTLSVLFTAKLWWCCSTDISLRDIRLKFQQQFDKILFPSQIVLLEGFSSFFFSFIRFLNKKKNQD